jgi:DNA-binding IclR family transcriptional regulator
MMTAAPAVERIVAEYKEMPGLSLTAAQASRLFGLPNDRCVTLLQALVAQGRLRRRADGRYCAAGDLERVWPLSPLRPRRSAA